MKLEEGMYVRTTDEGIVKIIEIDEDVFKADNNYYYIPDSSCIIGEPSYDITDLIEVGDVIKFKELRTHLTNDSGTKYREIYILDIHAEEELRNIKEELENNKIEILAIMTKEQIESMQYVIE